MKLTVTVKPGARRARVEETSPGEVRVSVCAPAREGKANAALIEALAEHFGVPKSRVRILRGEGARKKIVEISEPGYSQPSSSRSSSSIPK